MFPNSDCRSNHGYERECENVVGRKNRSQLVHDLVPDQVAEEVAENAEAKEVHDDHRFLEGVPWNRMCDEIPFSSKAEVVQCENGKGCQKSIEENFSDGE